MGASRSSDSAYERNTCRMPLCYGCALADLYQTSIDFLLQRTDAVR